MSKDFWKAIALICIAFAAYEVWLNLHLRALNDACVRPVQFAALR